MLVECPSRWYLGVVLARTSATVRLAEALCGHDLGDLGMFLDGKPSRSAELTPLPRPVEINLGTVDSVQPYPREFLAVVRKRTHQAEGE